MVGRRPSGGRVRASFSSVNTKAHMWASSRRVGAGDSAVVVERADLGRSGRVKPSLRLSGLCAASNSLYLERWPPHAKGATSMFGGSRCKTSSNGEFGWGGSFVKR